MKLKGAKAVHYESGPNMTPLVDVVMVILIFLMLAGSFAGAEHYLVSNMPFRKNGGSSDASHSAVPDDPPLTINVDMNGTHDGYIARVDQFQATDKEQLGTLLTSQRDKLAAIGNGPDKVQVVVSPGRGVKWKYVTEVFEAAQLAKFEKIGFSTGH